MARSQYIYVALVGVVPAAGFTVKHELRTWLSRLDSFGDLVVWRVHDNGRPELATQLDIAELLK